MTGTHDLRERSGLLGRHVATLIESVGNILDDMAARLDCIEKGQRNQLGDMNMRLTRIERWMETLENGARKPHCYVKPSIPPAPEPLPNAAKPENTDADTLYCTFCQKDQHMVQQLIALRGKIFICDECVDLLATIVREKREGKAQRLEETP